jgi:hypothetical protein
MKIIILFLSVILSQTCFAQFKLKRLDKSSIPKTIQYTGKFVEGVRWADSTGDNIVLLTRTDNSQSKKAQDEGFREGALYAYHYKVSGDSGKLTWKVYDFIKDCIVDMIINYVDKSFAVTDLDKDGKAEVWIMYKASCQGDVSPVPMKIIMYEGNKKFALRGTTRVRVSETDYIGGAFTFDEAFKNGPIAFKQYAEKLWKEHKMETWTQ